LPRPYLRQAGSTFTSKVATTIEEKKAMNLNIKLKDRFTPGFMNKKEIIRILNLHETVSIK
jgi:hypothetical protein